ncbi:hypothetical protein U9R62_03805 [Cylindrospermopsis raciborskii DSH]|uniref:hypothetical protein n=1 Tax=Cylindrospermopsis raciborskii TaxID=77022 RepID=UPI002ED96A31
MRVLANGKLASRERPCNGDGMLLEAGVQVAADGRLLEQSNPANQRVRPDR